MFQSSPDPEAGCNTIIHTLEFDEKGFNPHPTRRPGATHASRVTGKGERGFNPHPTRRPGATVQPSGFCFVTIGFQSSPDPEAGCNQDATCRVPLEYQVSILTRPGGRVQPQTVIDFSNPNNGFNPHPTRRPGATPEAS